MPIKKTVSIRELARLAGCSKTAVSMALRNHPKISAKNRIKIQNLAKKHGYTRDPVISTLMNQLRSGRRNRTAERLGVLTWSQSPKDAAIAEKSDLFKEQLNQGMRRRSAELGYDLEVFQAWEKGMTGARLSRILYTRGIRGILLMSMPRARGHASLNWSYFAAATTGYTILKPSLHRAMPSHYQGMLLALRNFRRLGYERVGFVNLLVSEDMVNEAWLAAYLAHHFRTQGKIVVPPLLLDDWDSKKMSVWLEKYRIDAVVCNWMTPVKMMTELGYRVPRDIGFASLDCYPGLVDCAGIHQRRDVTAAMAVDLVVEQLETNRLGIPENPKIVLVDSLWKDGPTLLRKKS